MTPAEEATATPRLAARQCGQSRYVGCGGARIVRPLEAWPHIAKRVGSGEHNNEWGEFTTTPHPIVHWRKVACGAHDGEAANSRAGRGAGLHAPAEAEAKTSVGVTRDVPVRFVLAAHVRLPAAAACTCDSRAPST